MPWTWDLSKNRINETKHGIPFETALKVFADEYAITYRDPFPAEPRFRTIGYVGPLLLLVVHTESDLDYLTGERSGRIISARKATRAERTLYEEE